MKKKVIIGVIALITVLIGFLVIRSCSADADAAGYVQATLDLTFQGETEGAKAFVEASSDELEQMYENGIQAFASEYLVGDIDSQGLYTAAYEELVKQIFMVMRYQVHEAEKVEDDSYKIDVTYRTVDVFTKFIPLLQEESQKIQQAVNMGAYDGTEEEKLESALRDYLLFAQETLEMCYLEMEYGEEDIYTFYVKEQTDGSLEVQDNGMNTFIERILELDKL